MSVAAARLLRAAALAMAAVLLAACASLTPLADPPGTPREQVLARLGAPTGRYALPGGGERLQYSQAPAGTNVYNFDFGADGRLQRSEQALDPAVLLRIQIDRWTADDVRRLLGQPGRISRVYSFDGDVWSYRFLEFNNPRLIHIHIDPAGVVRRIQYTDVDRRRGFFGFD
ncbi:hypothetical protein [Xylophilus sp.]|uniref:hypothetical protein n=1 Tax=Xylophilus sp. TaxID=2653893 RepID=UPI0013B9A442|nr:hypothetical protein [Xylophilus sp.]KAF1048243.1 MAG: hypothetical protein GAK38_01492 [Xylophilus sp.]